MRPLIAITVESLREPENARTGGKLELNWNYAEAVAEAGGLPLVVPPVADMSQIAEIVDGWLVPGGNDLDSSLWGEPLHPAANLQDGTRYAAERRLFDALPDDAPIFGICYGCQLLNVLRGGSVDQHIPDALGYARHADGTLQRNLVEADSRLSRSAGAAMIEGKSYHHQAVGRLGRDLRIAARDEDGTIEAIEATDRPWLIGVQWHPERTPGDPATRRLFRSFVEAAEAYRRKRRG